VAGIILSSLVKYRKNQALDLAAHNALALLLEARSKTISSLNDARYGVHFDSNQAVLYKNSYVVSASTNKVYTFDTYVQLQATSLVGGGAEVLFDRLTGETVMSGTVTLSRKDDTSLTRILTVKSSGLVESN
jgi:hypothetical protein